MPLHSTQEDPGNKAQADKPSSFAIIIGAMKSGTTSLFSLLEQHPEIAGSMNKEPDFFSNEMDPSEHWDQYLELWDWKPARHKIALEASTSYTKVPFIPGVPDRIAASPAGDVKFIYMIRNPITRIASQVRHSLYEGWGKSLDEGMTEDLINFSQYAMQIDQYTARFPRENILLLTLEELNQSPGEVLRRICLFLGVSPDFQFKDKEKVQNTGDFFNIPPVIAALIKNPVMRWIGVRLLRGKTRQRVRSWLSGFGGHSDTLGRWQLNEDEIQEVWRLLASDIERLKNHYGIEVDRYWPVPANTAAESDGRD